MGVGEMLIAGSTLYRRHWKAFMVTAGLVNVPFFFLEQLCMTLFANPDATGSSIPDIWTTGDVTALFTAANNILIRPFVYGAVLSAVAAAYMGGSPLVRRAFTVAVARLASILWAMFLVLLGITSAMAAGYWAVFAEGGILPLQLVVAPAAFAVAAVLYVRWLFALTIVVIEGERGRKALARAWSLSAHAFWTIALTATLAHVPILLVDGALKLAGDVLSPALGSVGWLARAASIATSSVVTTPFNVVIAVLLYFDQRIRKEAWA